EIAHRLFARQVPGDVGQVHQAIDTAVQADEDAEVGNGLDDARDAVVLVVGSTELVPGSGVARLHAERDAATLLVDVEHHHLDLLADMHHLGRIDVLVGPIHLGDVYQTLDTLFDLDEAAVVGDVGDLAEQAGVFRIAARQIRPRILTQLLQA